MLITVKIYILTGILMLIGVYFTMRYSPSCALKKDEHETEMKLHKKKLLNILKNQKEKELYESYKKSQSLYRIGTFILFSSVLIHILIVVNALDSNLSIMHYISISCLSVFYIPLATYRENCFEYSIFASSKENDLNGINLYFKNLNGEKLNKDESKANKEYQYSRNELTIVRYAINFGAISLLILDIFFGNFIILSLS